MFALYVSLRRSFKVRSDKRKLVWIQLTSYGNMCFRQTLGVYSLRTSTIFPNSPLKILVSQANFNVTIPSPVVETLAQELTAQVNFGVVPQR
jgi:hypothetical protein